MSRYLFGKTIAFSFTPVDGAGEVAAVDSLVSARLYDYPPSEAQVDNSAGGHLQEILTWTAGASPADGSKVITFAAVTDTEPHELEEFEEFWVVVNFKYEAAGPAVFAKELIWLYRPNALTSRVTVTSTDIFAQEPKLEDVGITATAANTFVTEAKKQIFRRFKGLGSPQRKLFNLDELNDAVKYLATALACLSKYCREAPEWKDKFDLHMGQYEAVFAATEPGFNPEPLMDPDPTMKAKENVAYIVR